MKAIFFLSIPLLALLASCGSTPTSRIEQNPAIFNELSSNQQNIVREGKISRGMSKSAVYLALGNPSSKSAGEKYGISHERWDYTVMVPVRTYGYYPYYYGGYRYGRHHRYRRYYGMDYYPTVDYIARRGASVYFKSGRVTGWDGIRR